MRQVIVYQLTKLDELSKSLRTSFFSTRATRYTATLLLLLCLGVGNAWGTEYYLLDHSGSSATFTGQFICNPTAPTADARTISGQSFKGYVKTTGNMTSWSSKAAETYTIDYDVKTTSTTFTIYVGNTSSSTPQLYYVVYDESTEAHSSPDVVQTAIGDVIPKGNSTPQYTTRSVTITRSKNARVCFYTSQYNYTQIYQIVANETGTPLPKVGEGGYKLNLNKGRFAINGSKYAKIDCNLEHVGNDSYTMANGSDITLAKSAIASQYISFTTQSKKCNLKLTYSNGTMAYNTSQSGDGATAITSGTAYTLNGSTKYYLVNTSTKNGAPITLIEFECIAPTGLAASSATSSGATLTVTDAADINDYEFYISESSSTPNAATAATHTLTGGKTKVISDLSESTTYYAWVRSYYSANGKSSWVALTGNTFTTSAAVVSTKRIYMEAANGWNNSTPYFYAKSWGVTGSTVLMTQVSSCETNVFYADIPSGDNNILFTRQSTNSGIKYKDETGNYNQSVDINCTSNDKFTFNGTWDKNSTGKSDFNYGTYSAPTYTVTYNKNGDGAGNDGSVTGSVPTDSNSPYDCGDDVTVLGNTGSLALAGYSFNGWNTAANGSGTAKAADATYTITGNTTFYAQWTREAPTSVSIDGDWAYFPGQTISITAVPTGGTSDFTYQWQKYKNSAWSDLSNGLDATDGGTFSGVTTANLQISGCTKNNTGTYRCVVSKAGLNVNSSDANIKIYTLNGNYDGQDWVSNDITYSSGTSGTVSLTLNANSVYKFKIYDNYVASLSRFGYATGNYVISPVTYDCGPGNDKADIRLFTGPAGTYTFTVNIAHVGDGSPYVSVSIAYPSVTHPAAGYAYFEKPGEWTNVYLYWYTNDGDRMTDWGGAPELITTTELCGTTYYYAPVGTTFSNVIYKGNDSNRCPKSGYSLSTTGCSGKWLDKNDYETCSWESFTYYTISYAAGAKGSGSMTATSGICPDADQALPACSFTPNTGYEFDSWTASSSVKVGGETVTTGIADEATIQDVGANVTLTAQWKPIVYSISYKDQGNSTFSGLHIYTESDALPETHTYGSSTTLHKATKDGYVFGGWYTNKECTEGPVTSLGATAYTADIKLYAKWTAMDLDPLADNTLYKVEDMVPDGITPGSQARRNPGVSENNRFNIRGTSSSSSSADAGMTPRSDSRTIDGTSFTNVYRFDKPASGTDGTNLGSGLPTNHAIQFKISAAGKLDIYCYYGDSIYIVKDGGSAEVVAANKTAQKVTKSVTAGTYYLYSTHIGSNQRLYGLKFTPTYTVTYNANGGSGTTTDDSSPYATGSTVTTVSNSFTNSGYKFKWWNTAANGSGEDFYVGEKFNIAADANLYAQWESVASDEAFWVGDNFTFSDNVMSVGDMRVKKYNVDLNQDITQNYNQVNKQNGHAKKAKVMAMDANDEYIEIYFSDGSPIKKLYLGATSDQTTDQNIVVVYSASSDFTTAGGAAHEFKQVGENTNLVTIPGHDQTTKSVTDVSPSKDNLYTHARIYRRIGDANSVFDNTSNLGTGNKLRIYSIKAKKGTYSYSITYDCDGADSGCPSNATEQTALPNPLPDAPLKSGYMFDGWYTNSGKTDAAVAGATLTANATLYAKWTALEEKCQTMNSSFFDAYNDAWEGDPKWYSTINNVRYSFDGLDEENTSLLSFPSGSEDESWINIGAAGLGTIQEVKITFGNIGAENANSNKSGKGITYGFYDHESTWNFGLVSFYNKDYITGNTSVSFRPDDDDQDIFIFKPYGTPLEITSICIYYIPNGYTVTATATMNMDGTFTGSTTITNSPVVGIESGTSVSSSNNTFTIGETTVTAPTTIAGKVTVDDGGEPYNASCTWRFDHWNNLPATVTADVDDVEAEYIPTFAINYNTNGGTINAGQVDWYEYTNNDEDVVTLPTNVTKTGYTFDHWEDAGGTTRSYITCDYYGAFNLTANWSEDTHTVSVAAGAHGTVSPSSVSGVGIATASGNITATPATGYNFSSWTLPSGVTAADGFDSDDNPIQINATADDKTITATWTPVEYTITYTLNSGTNPVDPAPKTSYTIEDEDYDLPVPTRSGYVFQGWYDNSSFTGDRIYILESGSTGDTTYYAKWGSEVSVVWDIDAVDDKLYKGGGGHTVTAIVDDASWDASGDKDDLLLSASEGVILGEQTTGVYADGTYEGKAYVTAEFAISGDVDGDAITFTLTAPAAGSYGAIEDEKKVSLNACPSGGGGSTVYVLGYTNSTGTGYSSGQENKALSVANTWYTSTSPTYTDKTSTDGFTITATNVAYYWVQGTPGFNTSATGATMKTFKIGNNNDCTIKWTNESLSFSKIKIIGKNTADKDATTLTVSNDGGTTTRTFTFAKGSDVQSQEVSMLFTSGATKGISITGGTKEINVLLELTPYTPDGVDTDLEWDTNPSSDAAWDTDHLAKQVGDADFTFTASADNNSLGAVTYSSSAPSVATVNATTGKVHIVGAGSATITATLAESGCYTGNTATYDITVTSSCSDVAGTVTTENLGCAGVRMTVSGYTDGASIAWYKDGAAITPAETGTTYTATIAGTYYAVTTGSCPMASNSVVIENADNTINPIIFADEFTVKDYRPFEYRLMQIEEGETCAFQSATSWINLSDFKIVTDENHIVSIIGDKHITEAANETITVRISNTCGSYVDKQIIIHAKAKEAKPQIAWIATGTKGAKTSVSASESTNTDLYKALVASGKYDLTPRNCYWTTREDSLIKEYSKYDLVILTDYPNSQTGPNGKGRSKSYTNALGLLIDHVPMLTFEAFVSGCPNWGFESNPENTASTQNSLTLLCNANDIFGTSDVFNAGASVTVGEVADGQALQGFELDAMPNYVFIAKITDGGTDYVTCCERQENMNARMMVFGLNANVMDAITTTGQQMVIGFVDYLLKDENASIPDCSVIFKGTTDSDWSETANWEGNSLPNPYASVRIDKPCVVANGDIAKAGYVKIHVSTVGDTYTGSLTISPQAAMIVENQIYRVENDAYTDYLPTEPEDLVVEADEDNTGALIFSNPAGRTQATVQMYSKASGAPDNCQWQWIATPYNDVADAQSNYAGAWMYAWDNTSHSWSPTIVNGSAMEPFQGYCITQATADKYVMEGTLASTKSQVITLRSDLIDTKYNGVNLIGNSWTAPIHIGAWDVDDFDNAYATIIILNTGLDVEGSGTASTNNSTAGQYVSIPVNASSLMSSTLKVIPAMQAFQVKAKKGGGSLVMDYDRLVRDSAAAVSYAQENEPMRAPRRARINKDEIDRLHIVINGSRFQDEVYIFVHPDFTTEFDNGWDGEKIRGANEAVQLFVRNGSDRWAVAALPSFAGTQLATYKGEDGEYTITFDYSGDEELWWYDTKTDEYTQIATGNTYTYSTTVSSIQTRFLITDYNPNSSNTPTGVDETESNVTKVRKLLIDDHVYIFRGGNVYSVDGMLVK